MDGKCSRRVCPGLLLLAAIFLCAAGVRAQDRHSTPAAAPGNTVAANRSLPPPGPDPARADASYVIGPGDLLAIDVWNEPEITGKMPVRTDGKITVPLLGDVQASGLTPKSLQAILSQRLEQYVKEPAVTVAVEQMNSHRFNVLGEVQHPGSFPLAQETRVLDALAQAGGFSEFAKVSKIYVLRHDPGGKMIKLPFNYKRVTHAQADAENIELQAGDTVIVP